MSGTIARRTAAGGAASVVAVLLVGILLAFLLRVRRPRAESTGA
jgi:uncharacterized membrane protein affecting hemolysin expression